MGNRDFSPAGSAGSVDVGIRDQHGDIEEALAVLFDADALLDGVAGEAPPEMQLVKGKVKRALYLLDRPWN